MQDNIPFKETTGLLSDKPDSWEFEEVRKLVSEARRLERLIVLNLKEIGELLIKLGAETKE